MWCITIKGTLCWPGLFRDIVKYKENNMKSNKKTSAIFFLYFENQQFNLQKFGITGKLFKTWPT